MTNVQTTMTTEAMRALVDRHLAAEDDGDLDAAVAVYTPDIEHDVVGAPDGPLRGVDAARQRYEGLLKELTTDRMTTLRTYSGDNFYIIEHECFCTVKGQFAGIPGNGRKVSFRMLHIFEFRDGAVSRENVWMDTAGMLAQLS